MVLSAKEWEPQLKLEVGQGMTLSGQVAAGGTGTQGAGLEQGKCSKGGRLRTHVACFTNVPGSCLRGPPLLSWKARRLVRFCLIYLPSKH